MKKMRRLIAMLCIVTLLSCVFLTACDSNPDQGNASDNTGTNNNEQNTPTDPSEEDTSMNQDNKLYGKRIIWNGDSICQGSSRWGAWEDRIAAKNQAKVSVNYGVGGGTITENVLYASSGQVRHSVSATLEQMYEEFPNADYIIIEGGTNDADLIGRITEGTYPARFGSFDPEDFSGDYDRETYCGALESIFYRATRQYWSGKKVCYIVPQKMGLNAATSANRYAYFETAMQICEKWDIPYLNLWEGCDLDPTNLEMYDPNKTVEENEQVSMYKDGQHLTAAGYDLTADIIDAWLKTL